MYTALCPTYLTMLAFAYNQQALHIDIHQVIGHLSAYTTKL